MEPLASMSSYLKQFRSHILNLESRVHIRVRISIPRPFQPHFASTTFISSTFAWGLEPKLAELIRLPKENFLETVSGRISALVIVMKSVMRALQGPRMRGCEIDGPLS